MPNINLTKIHSFWA